ncbi:MAG: hypothetical protein DMF57_05020 [Acidobacteria bacterium]|nr:MAG: hypothetical protein DMF57_05020 [Acidobacteriota bacterium]
MRFVQDCPEARLLPSRFHFALARLLAMARSYATPPRPDVDRIVYAIDRHQNAAEHYAVSIWVVFSALPLKPAAAAAVSVILAPIVAQVPLVVVGVLVLLFNRGRMRDSVAINSAAGMTLLFLASAYFAQRRSPVRFVAWFFFVVVALNALAWVILTLMRKRIRQMETQCGI